ncbi:MAG TPA: LacI family DNA-binding transcriptional regulator, partial [Trueperaceae bacterium]|nr:LacI family DNA-binding transcriptional regulator [Trueperaceae bacterium]
MSRGPRRGQRPRLSDVAQRAGVSKAVASTVLNNRADSNIRASHETAERIRQAARELGYLPNPAAQSLAGGQNRILGVFTFEPIFPLAQQNFYHPFLLGIEQEAEELDYDLLLFTSARTGGSPRQRAIFRGGINRLSLADGSILLGREEDRAEVSQLIDQGYPFVYLGRRVINGAEVPYVGTDYASATAHIVRHLAELGHRDFAYLGSLGDHETSTDRQEGYARALADLDLKGGGPHQRRIQPAQLTSDVLRGWLARGVSAFVVEDDMVARRLLEVARADGLEIPASFSLALLGDPLEHVDEAIPWTMFRIPRFEMGRQAVRLLMEVM